MENSQGPEGPDFFEEIQKKIEKKVFQSMEEDPQKSPAPEAVQPQGQATEIGDSVGDYFHMEIVEADSNAVDLDDSFLEEVDCVLDDLEEQPAMSQGSAAVEPSGEAPESEPSVFQEDDQYLGELIDSEMVGKRSTTPEVPSPGLEEFSIDQEPIEGAGEVLNTQTLADLYAEQDHWEKAVEIYENLLKEDPLNEEYQSKLDEIRSRLETGLGAEQIQAQVRHEPSTVISQRPRQEVIHRLEAWLSSIHAEKERRCLKSI